MKQPMILYHGTTNIALPSIAEHGLKPRAGTGKDNWTHTVSSNPEAVYLSTCYALHFALAACGDSRRAKPAILEVDTDLLDEENLQADEDALEQMNHGRDGLPKDWSLRQRTEYYRSEAHNYYPEVSLNVLGTCGHRGTIPVSAIQRVATITNKQAAEYVLCACDPLIHILNYRFMGTQHNAFHRWIFDPSVEGFDKLSRSGLKVKQLTEFVREEA